MRTNPPSGGIPASESSEIMKTSASNGDRRASPARLGISSLPECFEQTITERNAPRFVKR